MSGSSFSIGADEGIARALNIKKTRSYHHQRQLPRSRPVSESMDGGAADQDGDAEAEPPLTSWPVDRVVQLFRDLKLVSGTPPRIFVTCAASARARTTRRPSGPTEWTAAR